MHFEPVSCEIKDNNPKELAKIVYTFFQHQYGKAIQNHILAESEYNAAINRNSEVEKAYNNDSEIFFGIMPRLPYNEYVLKSLRTRAQETLANKNDARMLLDFVVGRIIDGACEKD